MRIEKIRLKNFRNYEELELHPHGEVNLLFGQNGSGKTNLLEAIHYCALGKSHRVNHDKNTVMAGEEFGACGIELIRKNVKCDIAVKLIPDENAKKSIFIDQKKIVRLSDLMGRLQCVIFSPEDLELIREGPSVRRRYIDMLLSQINTSYFIALQQFRKALEQRNSILKTMRVSGKQNEEWLQDFEASMCAPARIIIEERKKIIQTLNEYTTEVYASISGRPGEILQVDYQSSLKDADDIEKTYSEMLLKNRKEDIMYGMTGQGPHRDDIGIRMNGKNMKMFASQGQIRTASLSLKLAQLKLYRDFTGDTPVLLLDDVMSELDMNRRTRLLKEIEGVQTFITCTDRSDLQECENKRTYCVSLDGNNHARIEELTEGRAEEKTQLNEPDFT